MEIISNHMESQGLFIGPQYLGGNLQAPNLSFHSKNQNRHETGPEQSLQTEN